MHVSHRIYAHRLLQLFLCSGLCIALAILPGCSLQEARDEARRMKSANNLRELGLAVYDYEATNKALPKRASKDKDGKPLLSWRVELLPYLGQAELYNEFRHDEPWDSEHNIKLLQKMPEVFRYPKSQAKPGMTVYVAPYGAKTIWDLDIANFLDVADGVSNTIMIAEVADSAAVPWTKPDDFDMTINNLLEVFGCSIAGGNCAFMDGSVRFVSKTIAEESFKALMTPSGGEKAIDIP